MSHLDEIYELAKEENCEHGAAGTITSELGRIFRSKIRAHRCDKNFPLYMGSVPSVKNWIFTYFVVIVKMKNCTRIVLSQNMAP